MVNIELFYKFCFENENVENKDYYFINLDSKDETITKEKLLKEIIDDGFNSNYSELISKWKYSQDNNELNELNNDEFKLKGEGPYKLYLHLIIDSEKEKEKRNKETNEEKNQERNDIKIQYSNIEQISNELFSMKRQLVYIKQNIKNEVKEMINYIKNNVEQKASSIKEENKGAKHLLTSEMMKNNYIIYKGNEEIFNNIEQKVQRNNQNCICGKNGIGKKYFAERLGYSLLEKNIFKNVYYLEINSIDVDNVELKINLLIDEICKYYSNDDTNIKLLLIIYFTEPKSSINEINQLILRFEDSNYKNINITFLYTFALADMDLKKDEYDFINFAQLEEKNLINILKKFDISDDKIKDIIDILNNPIEQNVISVEKEKSEECKNEIISPKKEDDKEIKNANDKQLQVGKIDKMLLFLSY